MSKLDQELSNGVRVYVIKLNNDNDMTNQSIAKYDKKPLDSKR